MKNVDSQGMQKSVLKAKKHNVTLWTVASYIIAFLAGTAFGVAATAYFW